LYLRFYPDNYVVAMSYAGSPEEVTEFIGRDYTVLPQGKYRLSGYTVTFTTKAARGEIDYTGTIDGENITFRIHSRITDFSGEQRFEFHKVAFPESAKAPKKANSAPEPTAPNGRGST
jgi:hypothetical protein